MLLNSIIWTPNCARSVVQKSHKNLTDIFAAHPLFARQKCPGSLSCLGASRPTYAAGFTTQKYIFCRSRRWWTPKTKRKQCCQRPQDSLSRSASALDHWSYSFMLILPKNVAHDAFRALVNLSDSPLLISPLSEISFINFLVSYIIVCFLLSNQNLSSWDT